MVLLLASAGAAVALIIVLRVLKQREADRRLTTPETLALYAKGFDPKKILDEQIATVEEWLATTAKRRGKEKLRLEKPVAKLLNMVQRDLLLSEVQAIGKRQGFQASMQRIGDALIFTFLWE